MAYSKTNWVDGTTEITAARLNNLETQHEKALVDARAASGNPLYAEIVNGKGSLGTKGRLVFDLVDNNFYVDNGSAWIKASPTQRTGHVTAQGSSVSGTTLRFRPQEGYYPGNAANSVQLSDANFVAANIKSGVNIFGMQGAFPIGGLISLQRGSGILSAGTNNITINSVDLNKTFVIFHGSGGTNFYSAVGEMNYATAKLTSSTNLQIQRQYNSSYSGNILYTYFVIEMNGISVQSGETDVPHDATSHNVTINSVDVNKSFPLFTLRSTAIRETPPFYMYKAQLTSSTNLNFAKQFASDVTYESYFDTIAWFVVTFDF